MQSRFEFPRTLMFVVVSAIALMLVSQHMLFAQSAGSTKEWSRPIPVSGALPGSWYPSVAATDDGLITVIWTSTQDNQDTIYLTQKNEVAWSRPVDILIGGKHADLRLDARNLLHLVFGSGGGVLASDAPVDSATSASNWNQPLQLSRQSALAGDLMTTPDGLLHTVWMEQDEKTKATQIIYSQSVNSASSWDIYRVIGENGLANARTRLARGTDGTLYAMWSAKSDKDNTDGVEINVSTTNGDVWLDTPRAFSLHDADILQPALAVDKNNALVLVYNFGVKDETFFQVSSDGGVTWSEQGAIPGLFAANPATGNDYFSIAYDSAGNVHLVAVGRKSKDQTAPGVYHTVWDGTTWSAPQELYREGNFIEFPDVSISNGNRVHVVFSTRSRNQLSGDPDESYQVWYTQAETDAPAATRVPLATITPNPTDTPTPLATTEPTRRPTPTRLPVELQENSAAPAPSTPFMPIIVAIVPVLLILAVVIVLTRVLRLRR